ncbi:DUF1214 domain-containing protein [Vineibacter terrae]|uniref:DUF1214 domain-containing protein n=1 Tax=Vineibacter terrae TaxID=2586908 RepID=UPI002E2F1D98|nr:DUF1214 domain-containing protein [Vineibacter terrae]HEX2884968.1 DUF1214 domain-containing protein [Vineibacter terrae]
MTFARSSLACGVVLSAAMGFTACVQAQPAPPTDKEIVDAYIYMYGRYLVLQQEHQDINVRKVGYNKITYNPVGSATVVGTNPDVADLEAWIAVDVGNAVILNVPQITRRYYTAQLVDGWGEVVANINVRTFPDRPSGAFALVLKGTHPAVPDGAIRIEVPAPKVKLLARVELKGTPDHAVQLQRRFTLDVPPGIKNDPPLRIPAFSAAAPITATIFDNVAAVLATCPDPMPRAGAYQAMAQAVSAYMKSNTGARARVEDVVRNQAIPALSQGAKGLGTHKGGWSVTYAAGRFGDDIMARAIVNAGGTWANIASETTSFAGLTDRDRLPLHGSRTYLIRFPREGKPEAQVNAFWAMTLYSVPDHQLVSNALQRFGLSSLSGVKLNTDGSLNLWLAPTQPKGIAESNWLPTPAGRAFALELRMYAPKPDVLDGTWFPAPIQRVH